MKNNKGLSLIELIIAFALLALVGVGAMGLMATGSNLFSSSSKEVDLQLETQMIMNHLNNFIIDTERGLNFTDNTDTSVLEVFNEDIIYVVTWDKTTKELYYQERTISYSGGTTTEGTNTTMELLATNVENFVVDLSKVESATESERRMVDVQIKLAYGERKYEETQRFWLRNDVKADGALTEYYNDEVVGLINTVTGIEISETVVYCATGSTHAFTARVTGIGYPSQRVTWSLEGQSNTDPDTGTRISEYGLVTIADDETSSTLTVKVKSVANGSFEKQATIHIVSVDNIDIVYDPNSAMVGKVMQVEAVVDIGGAEAASIPSSLTQKVIFTLPDDNPDGVEMYQTSSMTNYCEMIFGTDMEQDPDVIADFADPSRGSTTVRLQVASAFDPSHVFTKTIDVAPSNLNSIGIVGELTANRNSTLELDATLEAQGITSREIRTTWAITDDAGLGDKVRIDENTGILTVDKDIDYNREFKIEVTVTASVSNSSKKVDTAVNVTIPKVTISVPATSATIEKGSSERILFAVHGLKVEKGDVVCTSKPSLKNTLMYCTENECVISVGEGETRDLVAVRLALKENTDISNSINLYILSQTDMYNVEGRKNVFAPYYTPAEVGNGKDEKSEGGTTLKYSVDSNKTKLTIKTTEYYYNAAVVVNGVTGWWLPESNVEGAEYYIPVPGLSPDLPDTISVSYKLNYNGYLLTYSVENGTTYVDVEFVVENEETGEKETIKQNFYLDGEAWKIRR